LGIEAVSNKSTLFEVLWELTRHVAKTDEEETLSLVSPRMAAMSGKADACVAECLGLQEGIDLLDRDEEQEVKQQQKHMQADVECARALLAGPAGLRAACFRHDASCA
jgi:hypothetical protein